MKVGSTLRTEQGFQSMLPGQDYLYLGSIESLVSLGWYSTPTNSHSDTRAHVCCIPRSQIEEALSKDVLIEAPPSSLPPWLAEVEGLSFDHLERRRPRAKRTYQERAEQRYVHIQPLIDRAPALLFEASLYEEVAKHARQCTPAQNPARLLVWLLAYWSTGRNLWSLVPPFHRAGRWGRSTDSNAKKLGRPSKQSGAAGFSGAAMAEKIQDAYYARARMGETMSKIYRRSLMEDFGCTTSQTADGAKIFIHPKGEPFPSHKQFVYRVAKKFGPDQVQSTLYGEIRVRTKSKTSQGRFTEPLAELLETCEVDAFHLKEVPRCLLLDQPAPPLVIARAVCGLSGRRVGIGVSFASEKAEAYKLMLFTMCTPGDVLSRLFGLPLTNDQWPGAGVMPHEILDRGAGTAVDVSGLEDRFPIRELAPSYSGQSKARVESSHPRAVRHEGAPTHVASQLNVVELFRREVMRCISDNEASNVSPMRTLQMIARDVQPNPIGVWNYFDKIGRNSAVHVDFSTAVRRFLSPRTFFARADGLYLNGIYRFDSPELRKSRLLNRLSRHTAAEIRGYIFPLMLRRAYIELDGRICEVAPVMPIRDGEHQLDVSLYELELLDEKRRAQQCQHAIHAQAAKAEAEERFEQATGKKWHSYRRKPGSRPKASAEAIYEKDIVDGSRRIRP